MEPHLAIEASAQEDMVAVVQHAFSDICSARHSMDIAAWTHTAAVNVEDMVLMWTCSCIVVLAAAMMD